MIWLALLLWGVAVADLVASWRESRALAGVAGAAAVLAAGAGLVPLSVDRWAVVVALAGYAALWSFVVDRCATRERAWAPLTLGVLGLLVAVAFSGAAPEADGPLARGFASVALPVLASTDPTRAALLIAVFAAQLSTGNVVVRLVLTASGTLDALRRDVDRSAPEAGRTDPSTELKGGRLLGPMERIVILGLGLAGNLTAATIVVAAKGLLRFPELSSDAGQGHVHRLTEYFLVGSLLSWLIALGSLALLWN